MHTIGSTGMWIGFAAVVVAALVVDFMVLGARGSRRVSFRQALAWSAAWIALALAFDAGLWWWLDASAGRLVANQVALEFLTGYVIEKALALDNIFVFLMLFGYFAVPLEQQRRALMFGVLGAIVLRAIMILVGAALIARFHWILYLFGLFLLVTGVRMLMGAGEAPDIANNPLLRWIRRHLHVTDDFRGSALSVFEHGQRWFTPLFVVIALIAVTDVIFAVDSIPAVFAITQDPFVVLTSNVFAVLGLRALFFMLAGMVERFHLLGYGLSAVLIFIGIKMLVAGVWQMPIGLALGVVAVLIAGAVLASLLIPPRRAS